MNLKKYSLLTVFFLSTLPLIADDFLYPKGSMVGIGGSFAKHTFDISPLEFPIPNPIDRKARPNTDYPSKVTINPTHIHTNKELVLFIENRAMMNSGPIYYDVRGELSIAAFSGQTETSHDHEITVSPNSTNGGTAIPPAPTIISTAGTKFTALGQLKTVYPIEVTPRIRIAPYLGFGLGISLMQSDQDGIPDNYNSDEDIGKYTNLNYSAGWDEFVLQLPVAFGMNIDFETFSISPEVRYAPFGLASTGWKPGADPTAGLYTPEVNTYNYIGFMVNIGFRVGA